MFTFFPKDSSPKRKSKIAPGVSLLLESLLMRLSNYLPLKCGNKSCPATKCLWEELTCGWSDRERNLSFLADKKLIIHPRFEGNRASSGGNNRSNKVFARRRQNEKDRFQPAWLKVTVRARTVRKIYRGLIHQLQRPFFWWKLRILIKTTVKTFCQWTQGRKGCRRSGRNNEISVVK